MEEGRCCATLFFAVSRFRDPSRRPVLLSLLFAITIRQSLNTATRLALFKPWPPAAPATSSPSTVRVPLLSSYVRARRTSRRGASRPFHRSAADPFSDLGPAMRTHWRVRRYSVRASTKECGEGSREKQKIPRHFAQDQRIAKELLKTRSSHLLPQPDQLPRLPQPTKPTHLLPNLGPPAVRSFEPVNAHLVILERLLNPFRRILQSRHSARPRNRAKEQAHHHERTMLNDILHSTQGQRDRKSVV